MQNNIQLQLINSILRFYEVDEITDIYYKNNSIYGTAVWRDIPNEVNLQKFVWKICLDNEKIKRVITILDHIFDNKKFYHDKILISDDEIKEIFLRKNWDIDTIEQTINNLYNIDIRMIDDEEETDSFFLHQ
ncbi:MAG: hypothetical protein LBG67_03960 [Campylobacteraceae bacterium]|jgi:hypothetical protein|nr:hypothetical protein [Campylobacteraceae bacterium]